MQETAGRGTGPRAEGSSHWSLTWGSLGNICFSPATLGLENLLNLLELPVSFCVCVYVRTRARACVCVGVRVRVCMCEGHSSVAICFALFRDRVSHISRAH